MAILGTVDPFALTILWPWVRIPSIISTFFNLHLEKGCEKEEKTPTKRGRD